MENRAVLITGGADRIGREVAFSFADIGFDVALHYLSSKEKAESARREIVARKRNCTLYQADLRDSAEVSSLIDRVCRDYDLCCLVNNASLFVESSIADGDCSLFEKLLDVNFKAPYILTKEFARLKGEGMVINMLDTKIAGNSTSHFDYLLTKKFLEDFTKMAALHLAPGIRVNGIAPGLILPPRGKGVEYLENLAKDIPLERPGSLKHIKSTVKYLTENDFITGEVIYVDGGENLL